MTIQQRTASMLANVSAIKEPTKPQQPIVVVLDNLRSRYNVGAAFRTSDAFSVEHIYLCGITPTPPHREIRKTALGAESIVTWSHHQQTLDPLETLRAQGYQLIAIEQTNSSIALHTMRPTHHHTPSAFVFGNEVWGVSQQVLEKVDTSVEIIQYGTKHSLNVATCIGIVLWQSREMLHRHKN